MNDKKASQDPGLLAVVREVVAEAPEESAALVAQFLISLAVDGVLRGEIDLHSDKSVEDIASDVTVVMRRIESDGAPFAFQLEYRSSLKREADRFKAQGDYDFAIMFLATIIEHSLNSMILQACEGRGLKPEHAKQVLRDCNLNTKTGWLWTVLFDGELSEDLRKSIITLADKRNAFVHYKYTALDESLKNVGHEEGAYFAQRAVEVVEELTRLEDDFIYRGRKEDLLRAIALSLQRQSPD